MDQDEITALGASLRRIDQNILTPRRVWYQGGEPYFDLFVELRDEEIEWFQFTLRGKSLSWNKSGWQTGITNEGSVNDITFYSASKLIKSDSQPDCTFIELVHSVLKSRADEHIIDKVLALFDQELEARG